MDLCATLLFAALSACAPNGSTASLLGRNMLACRDAAIVATLHKASHQFQRVADNAIASGRCRMFGADHVVKNVDRAKRRFVDPESGRTFWAYIPG